MLRFPGESLRGLTTQRTAYTPCHKLNQGNRASESPGFRCPPLLITVQLTWFEIDILGNPDLTVWPCERSLLKHLRVEDAFGIKTIQQSNRPSSSLRTTVIWVHRISIGATSPILNSFVIIVVFLLPF